jgi:predicted lipoprotein with Yx(FWY)xxD motif
MRNLKLAGAGLGAAALLAAAGGIAAPAGAAAADSTVVAAHSSQGSGTSSTELKTRKIGNVTVVTNAKGFTLYSFAPDTPSKSNCNGSCAQIWLPLKGPATAGPGVTGKLSTIKRSDGSTQATYNGHPVYIYTGDTKPGQATGNGLNVNGGVWHEVPVSAKAAPAASTSHSSSGGGY